VDAGHPDLAGRVLAGSLFVQHDARATDDYGYGTRVTGIAADTSDNDQGVASGAWQSDILPVKVADGMGRAADRSAQGLNLGLRANRAVPL
jgi:serine protease